MGKNFFGKIFLEIHFGNFFENFFLGKFFLEIFFMYNISSLQIQPNVTAHVFSANNPDYLHQIDSKPKKQR